MDLTKEKIALERLRAFAPDPSDPYYVCYSGGKDSDVIRILCELSGVPYELHHNHTGIDAPETVYYIRSIQGVSVHYPSTTMWRLIVKNLLPPFRTRRYCCDALKEYGGRGRLKVTGVRASESVMRSKNAGVVKILGKPKHVQRIAEGTDYDLTPKGGLVYHFDNPSVVRVVQNCQKIASTMVNPIIDWSDQDVWDFLHHYSCSSNPLYQCGYKRIGCVGCPMRTTKSIRRDFRRYPKFRHAYVRAFDRMLIARLEAGKDCYDWRNGEDVMRWWIGDDPAQLSFFEGDDYY